MVKPACIQKLLCLKRGYGNLLHLDTGLWRKEAEKPERGPRPASARPKQSQRQGGEPKGSHIFLGLSGQVNAAQRWTYFNAKGPIRPLTALYSRKPILTRSFFKSNRR